MQRKSLLEQLSTVSPAISATRLVPILSHYWFTGESLMAYNDQIAISVPLKTPFQAAVPGTLKDLLTASAATEVSIDVTGTAAKVKLGKANATLPIMGKEDFVYAIPKSDKSRPNIAAENLAPAIATCMRSVSLELDVPDVRGVTIIPGDDCINVFSTNHSTITYCRVPGVSIKMERLILTEPFCSQFIALTKQVPRARLEFHENAALLLSKEFMMAGRYIESPAPLNFLEIVGRLAPKNEKTYQIPKLLDRALERASLIARLAIDKRGKTKIKITDGVAVLHTVVEANEITDKVALQGHPDVELSIDPTKVLSGLKDFETILFKENCATLRSGSRKVYLVSASGA